MAEREAGHRVFQCPGIREEPIPMHEAPVNLDAHANHRSITQEGRTTDRPKRGMSPPERVQGALKVSICT